jgi:anti-anti-sigma factor
MFKCWVEDSRLAAIVHVQGDIDLLTAHEFRECMRRTATSNTHNGYVIVDMSKLEYIDGGGLRVLAEGHELCQQHSRELMLLAPSPHIERILAIVNLTDRLPVLNSVEALSVHAQFNGDHPHKSGEEDVTAPPLAASHMGTVASSGKAGECDDE